MNEAAIICLFVAIALLASELNRVALLGRHLSMNAAAILCLFVAIAMLASELNSATLSTHVVAMSSPGVRQLAFAQAL